MKKVFAMLLLLLVGCSSKTVPSEVLSDGQAGKAQQVYDWGMEEVTHLDKGWTLPPFSLSAVRPLGWNGITVITGKPTRYDVLLTVYAYPREEGVRFTTAHEIAHVLMAEKGLPQSEETADAFAYCYGSAKAKVGARERGVTADCGEVRKQFE